MWAFEFLWGPDVGVLTALDLHTYYIYTEKNLLRTSFTHCPMTQYSELIFGSRVPWSCSACVRQSTPPELTHRRVVRKTPTTS